MRQDVSDEIVVDKELRDYLAIERTSLANERTLLAYIRSSLALCAAGITFLEFFQSTAYTILGFSLFAGSVGTLGVGMVRFIRSRYRITHPP